MNRWAVVSTQQDHKFTCGGNLACRAAFPKGGQIDFKTQRPEKSVPHFKKEQSIWYQPPPTPLRILRKETLEEVMLPPPFPSSPFRWSPAEREIWIGLTRRLRQSIIYPPSLTICGLEMPRAQMILKAGTAPSIPFKGDIMLLLSSYLYWWQDNNTITHTSMLCWIRCPAISSDLITRCL